MLALLVVSAFSYFTLRHGRRFAVFHHSCAEFLRLLPSEQTTRYAAAVSALLCIPCFMGRAF